MLTNLALITTTRCDLKCQHCLRGFPKERPDFPIELLDKLLIEAIPFGVKHVGLTGGEPHLHPQFEQIVEKIVSYGYTWHFVSHGQRTEPYLPIMERYRDSFISYHCEAALFAKKITTEVVTTLISLDLKTIEIARHHALREDGPRFGQYVAFAVAA